MQSDRPPSMKHDYTPTKHDSSSSLKHVDSPSKKCKSSPSLKRDGSPSLFNPMSQSMVEVEETSGRDTISNLEGVLTINIPDSTKPGAQLVFNTSHEKPSARPDARYGFFDSEMRSERWTYIKTIALSTFMTALVLLSVLSIYWGTLWKLDEHAYKLRGIVVDFDQDAVGKAVSQAAQERTGSLTQITWTVEDPSSFNHDILNVAKAVLDEQYWVAIVVQSHSTEKLHKAIASADNTYDGTSAVTVYVSPARQEQAYSHFILQQFSEVLASAQLSFRQQHARLLSQTPGFNLTMAMANAPQTIVNPLDFRVNDLRPFDVPIVTAVTALGLIYVTLAALVTCNLSSQARNQLALRDKLTFRSLVQIRICSPLISYLWISLFYALLSVLYHVPFGRFRGGSGFMLCWLMFFLGMSALGLTIEVVNFILIPQYVSYFLILWVIWNISVCYLPVDVLPRVYRYAYISPFYNVNRAVRAIILGTKNDLAINFAVQLSWITVSSINIILCELWQKIKIKNSKNRNVTYA